MQIKLSVIIPVYNSENHLKICIESLLNQTIGRYEVILVDDGSTDESGEICDKYSAIYEKIRVIHQQNCGVSAARNTGINNAAGDYLTFVDSDDFVSETYVESVLKLIEIPADLYILDNYIGEKIRFWIDKKKLREGIYSEDLGYVYQQFMEYRLNAPWDKIFLREIINTNKIRFIEGFNMGEDLLFCLEYLKNCKIIIKNEISIYYHTTNEEGLCHQIPTLERIQIFERIYGAMKNFIHSQNLDYHYIKIMNTSMLRNLVNLLGKLRKNKISPGELKSKLNKSEMYSCLINESYINVIDSFRKSLLKNQSYIIMSILFKKNN